MHAGARHGGADYVYSVLEGYEKAPAGLDLNGPAARIGVSCRICERTDCTQRAFPPLDRALHVPENERGVVPYVLDGPRPDRY